MCRMRVRRSRKVGDREIGVSGTRDSHITKPRYAISRKDPGRPSARTGGKGSGVVGVLLIGVFDGKEIVRWEIAIRDFPIRSEPFK